MCVLTRAEEYTCTSILLIVRVHYSYSTRICTAWMDRSTAREGPDARSGTASLPWTHQTSRRREQLLPFPMHEEAIPGRSTRPCRLVSCRVVSYTCRTHFHIRRSLAQRALILTSVKLGGGGLSLLDPSLPYRASMPVRALFVTLMVIVLISSSTYIPASESEG